MLLEGTILQNVNSPKWITFNVISINILIFVCKKWQADSKIKWKCKRPRGIKTTLKSKVGGLTLPAIKV